MLASMPSWTEHSATVDTLRDKQKGQLTIFAM
jgi:hypothetical protein